MYPKGETLFHPVRFQHIPWLDGKDPRILLIFHGWFSEANTLPVITIHCLIHPTNCPIFVLAIYMATPILIHPNPFLFIINLTSYYYHDTIKIKIHANDCLFWQHFTPITACFININSRKHKNVKGTNAKVITFCSKTSHAMEQLKYGFIINPMCVNRNGPQQT